MRSRDIGIMPSGLLGNRRRLPPRILKPLPSRRGMEITTNLSLRARATKKGW